MNTNLKDVCKLVIEYISDKDNPWYSDFRCLTENRTQNVHNDLKEFIKDIAVTGPDFEIFNDEYSCDVCAFLLNIYAHSIDTKCDMALCYASKFNFERSFTFAKDICTLAKNTYEHLHK